jgi:uncharacterized membrane protein
MWRTRFRLSQHLKGSLWVLPVLGAVVGGLVGVVSIELDDTVSTTSYWHYSSSTATSVLAAIVGASAALTGFVVTVSVLVVQMATQTFSPRYMRLFYRDRLQKAVLAFLVGTLTCSFVLLPSIESDSVPDLGVTLAGASMTIGLILFVFFLDHFIHRLRPVAVAAQVARAGRRVFEEGSKASRRPMRPAAESPHGPPALVVPSDSDGAIQALDTVGLVRWARERDCVVVLVHPVGNFVPTGAALLEVHGEVSQPESAAAELRGMVALGIERTIEQDVAFAIRILVDIAAMALSPAVNAPTTAVQVLNHLEDLLRVIGATDLAAAAQHVDEHGRLRVVVPTQGWAELLALGVTEIRLYGANAIQVLRRLRAVLDELRTTVRPEHRAAVDAELERLDLTVELHFGDTPDLDRARVADRQGIGGPGALPGPI